MADNPTLSYPNAPKGEDLKQESSSAAIIPGDGALSCPSSANASICCHHTETIELIGVSSDMAPSMNHPCHIYVHPSHLWSLLRRWRLQLVLVLRKR